MFLYIDYIFFQIFIITEDIICSNTIDTKNKEMLTIKKYNSLNNLLTIIFFSVTV